MSTKMTKLTAWLMLLSTALTGCGGTTSHDYSQIPMVDRVSTAEIREYYKEAIKVKDISQMTISTAVETSEFREVSNEEMDVLLDEIGRAEKLLASNAYTPDDYLDVNTYQNLKIFLDDRHYTRGDIVFSGAQREKFTVDVQYIGKAKPEGKVHVDAKYLGVHGVFRKDVNGIDYKDQVYIDKIEEAILEEQALLQKKENEGIVDTTTTHAKGSFKSSDVKNEQPTPAPTPQPTPQPEAQGDSAGLDPGLLEGFGDATPAPTTPTPSTGINVTDLADYGEVNLKVYNNIFGSSLNETAFVPRLDMVFTPSDNGNKLGGYGIYSQGSLMGDYGINPKELTSVVTIRYIFTTDIADKDKINLYGAYVREQEMEGLPEFENELLPQFVISAIEQLVDRADRVKNNDDVTGMANGEIYDDIRNTILFGTFNNATKASCISRVSRYLVRDNANYLVEIKTVSDEDNMYDNLGQGRYEDTYILLIEQQLLDDSFVIIDWIRTGRQFLTEPPFEYTSSVDKRYHYLSLEGTTPDSVKPEIKAFLQTQITAANEKEWNTYYQNINHNTEMLGKTQRDDIYLTTKKWCERMGSEKEYVYYGAIVNWIGGTTQIEFTTEELIVYPALNQAQWTTNYYVVSSYEDKWVIDELTNLDIQLIEGDEIHKKKAEIESYASFVPNTP